jgi:hypothetical protein
MAGRLHYPKGFREAVEILPPCNHRMANEDVVAAMTWPRAQRSRYESHCRFGILLWRHSDSPCCRKRTWCTSFHCLCTRREILGQWSAPRTFGKCGTKCKRARVRPASEQRLQCRPTNVLGKIAKTNGGQAGIYPAFGNNSQDGHWSFATTNSGIEVWQKDVLDFINSIRETTQALRQI